MYGYDVDDSYGYPGGLKLAAINAESITITATAPDTRFPTGTVVLVTGKVVSSEPIKRVTIDGVPVEALDAAGNFFTRVTISAGDNVFTFVGESVSGLTADTALTLNGFNPDGIRFDTLSDVSATTVYFTDADGEHATADAVGKNLGAPVEARIPPLSDQPPGVIVIVAG